MLKQFYYKYLSMPLYRIGVFFYPISTPLNWTTHQCDESYYLNDPPRAICFMAWYRRAVRTYWIWRFNCKYRLPHQKSMTEVEMLVLLLCGK